MRLTPLAPTLLQALLLTGPTLTTAAPAQDDATWRRLEERPFPRWFQNARLGIFIHWGVYSVPAWCGPEQYAEWFLRGLQVGDAGRLSFLRTNYGPNFDYRDFAPRFRAELWDPARWAELFRASGAGYVVLTAKHHDGYCLWPSAQARGWNSVDNGPGRDLVGELGAAVRAAGLRMGLYYSLPEWNNPLYRWGAQPAVGDVDRYVAEHMVPQFKDLMARYRPSVVFSDGDWDHPASTWKSAELIDWLRRESGAPADVVVNDRWGKGCTVGFATPEYSAGQLRTDRPWAECRGLGRSFGLNRAETLDAYLSAEELVHMLVSTVSHGGGLLLNVGPAADGRIPLLQQERLRELGAWLQVNGRAIHGTRSWQRPGEWRPHTVRTRTPDIDVDWVRNAPAPGVSPDHFTATWSGRITPPHSGSYRLVLSADDHASLELDGREVLGAPGEVTVDLRVDRPTPFTLRFREDTHQATCRLAWQPPGASEVAPIPEHALGSAATDRPDGVPGVPVEFSSSRQHVAYTRDDAHLYVITLDWPTEPLRLVLPRPAADAAVHLLGNPDKPVTWSWQDGVLSLDPTDFRPQDLPCRHAWTFAVPLPGD